MKCTKCGCEFTEGLFCPECGTKYDENEALRVEAEKQNQAEIERQNEAQKEEERKHQEEIRIQEEAAHQEELRKQQEALEKTEKEKREVEIAKAKVEQERLAKERTDKEAELMKQKNENMRMEQQKAEELTRTFNGRVYESIEQMELAKNNYEREELNKKHVKKVNAEAIWSLVLGIATYPLVMTFVLWFPTIIISIILGIMALKGKTKRKGCAIAGIVLDVLFIAISVYAIYTM